jgi:hypothetical protein
MRGSLGISVAVNGFLWTEPLSAPRPFSLPKQSLYSCSWGLAPQVELARCEAGETSLASGLAALADDVMVARAPRITPFYSRRLCNVPLFGQRLRCNIELSHLGLFSPIAWPDSQSQRRSAV